MDVTSAERTTLVSLVWAIPNNLFASGFGWIFARSGYGREDLDAMSLPVLPWSHSVRPLLEVGGCGQSCRIDIQESPLRAWA